MKKLFLLLIIGFSFFWIFPWSVRADEVEDLKNKITSYENQLKELGKQKDSLSKEIALMDGQIKLTSLKITQSEAQIKALEKEIVLISGKIINLDDSLNYLSKVLLSRIVETYKNGKIDPLTILFSSRSFSEFISRYRYLQAAQLHDREMLLAMEKTRTNYDEQKQLKETAQTDLEKLQKQLEAQKKQLSTQVEDRKRLLEETKGKEANYQSLLSAARSELEAILGILQGKGQEKEIKKVSEGEKIASVIEGSSCNSSGTHLHFMLTKDNSTVNPFSYLKGGIDFENCSGSSCGSGNGDVFNPSGSWEWPINPKIKLGQGYGYTWAVQHTWVGRIYNFHNGIDIVGSSAEVKAAKPGTLYWGNYIGNCTLHYVRVRHDEDGIDTYYLHVNF